MKNLYKNQVVQERSSDRLCCSLPPTKSENGSPSPIKPDYYEVRYNTRARIAARLPEKMEILECKGGKKERTNNKNKRNSPTMHFRLPWLFTG